MPKWLKIGLMIFGVALIIGSIWLFVYQSGRASDAADWPIADGVITLSDVERVESTESSGSGSSRRTKTSVTYYPRVAYRYATGGRDYDGTTLWLTTEEGFGNAADAGVTLRGFPVGGKVAVFYNPADPSDSALLINPPSKFIFLATLFGAIFLAVGYFVPLERPFMAAPAAVGARRKPGNPRTRRIVIIVFLVVVFGILAEVAFWVLSA